MAAGDLTASTPVLATTPAEIKTAIDALNLALDTDKIGVISVGNTQQFYVFKVEREA